MHKLSTTRFIRELAVKHGLPFEVVNAIVRSQFEFVAETIRSGNMEKLEFKTVLLAELGKFAVKKTKIKKLEELNRNGVTYVKRRQGISSPDSTDNKGVQ